MTCGSVQAIAYTGTEDVAGREAIAKWTIGFTQALRAHLQQDSDLRGELAKVTPAWSEQEIDMLAKSHHKWVGEQPTCSETPDLAQRCRMLRAPVDRGHVVLASTSGLLERSQEDHLPWLSSNRSWVEA